VLLLLFTASFAVRMASLANHRWETRRAARVLYGWTTAVAYVRTLRFCAISRVYGPKLIMLRLMVGEVKSFLLLAFTAMCAYGFAMYAILDRSGELDIQCYTLPGGRSRGGCLIFCLCPLGRDMHNCMRLPVVSTPSRGVKSGESVLSPVSRPDRSSLLHPARVAPFHLVLYVALAPLQCRRWIHGSHRYGRVRPWPRVLPARFSGTIRHASGS